MLQFPQRRNKHVRRPPGWLAPRPTPRRLLLLCNQSHSPRNSEFNRPFVLVRDRKLLRRHKRSAPAGAATLPPWLRAAGRWIAFGSVARALSLQLFSPAASLMHPPAVSAGLLWKTPRAPCCRCTRGRFPCPPRLAAPRPVGERRRLRVVCGAAARARRARTPSEQLPSDDADVRVCDVPTRAGPPLRRPPAPRTSLGRRGPPRRLARCLRAPRWLVSVGAV